MWKLPFHPVLSSHHSVLFVPVIPLIARVLSHDLAAPEWLHSTIVYSLVFDGTESSFPIGACDAVIVGKAVRGDPLAEDAYLGRAAILNDLSKMKGWVVLDVTPVVRDLMTDQT